MVLVLETDTKNRLLIVRLQVRVLPGSFEEKIDDIEQFLASLRFKQRGRFEELGIEIDTIE